MGVRKICEYIDGPEKAPVSKRISEILSKREIAQLNGRLLRIENDQVVTKQWLKHYSSLSMMEIRHKLGGKAFRILCHQDGERLIMLIAEKKNGNLTQQDHQRAVDRRDKILKDGTHVRDYPLPGRASNNVGQLR